ncbi:carbohydrate ABC transporter permease [Paenibacillus mucilaginosus]|uniref:ABC transporter permease n=2 Tax=Paenibacillus mucilaginosus TaxID=61624 RepID=I0BTA7_9BACL|nr:sugar ABC transporter permease [Paenibacillus mucilaginosus]AEI45598.1 binding-protein-dependent transport systems inner membrane component [Paenibacillus mucilaginosus KNP414]AFH65604.1 ABC transporter permease [Paenibacillus mucilaginosus K02]MCG7215345.1 sugar ABC transporter permease [Paenibacillus mucilaginosus]WDM27006.1 sugar ABC transporter permease [Paenibacillus mucilaginosus]
MNVLKVPGRTIAVFVLPCLLIYVGLVFVPILVSFYSSLLDWNGIGASKFIGFDNYVQMFTADPVFWPAVKRTLMFAVFSMVEIPVALFVAILLNRYVRKPNFLVSSYFLPVILSVVIVGQLWKTIYNPASLGGMLNQILIAAGLESWTKAWLTDPSVAMYALYIVALWQYLGYHVLIQFTGIQNIPSEVYEAAKIDGAEGFTADRYITLPMVVPIFKISIVLAFIGSLQAFDMIMVMTGGGPAHATDVIATLMYNMSFLSMKYGYGSALASFLVVLCLVATVIINFLFKKLEARYT